MSISVAVGTHHVEGGGSGARSFSAGLPAGTYEAIVVVDVVGAGGTAALGQSFAYDGAAMSAQAPVQAATGAAVRCWVLQGSTYSGGAVNVTFTDVTNNTQSIRVYGLQTGAGASSLVTAVAFTKTGTSAEQMDFGSQSSTLEALIIGGKAGVSAAPLSGFTNDTTQWLGGTHANHGHETTPSTGARTLGWAANGSDSWATAGVLLEEALITIAPDPVLLTVILPAPTVAAASDVTLQRAPVRLKVRLPAPSVTTPHPRQVVLGGEGIEEPELTEGGIEGAVLTRHVDRKPTWEPAAAALTVAESDGSPEVTGVSRLEVADMLAVTDDGAGQATIREAGHWEPVILAEAIVTLDGDIVMVWVAD